MLYFYQDFVLISSDDIGIVNVDVNNMSLEDNDKFENNNPETIIHVRVTTWCNKQHQACKKEISKDLMPVAWYMTRSYGWHKSENGKKEIKQFLRDEM